MNTIQFNPLNYPLYVSAKPVGAACNLRCDYCYFLEKENFHSKGGPQRMSDELLERFTEQYVHAQPGQDVLFTWHGGEPLLLGLEYFKKALRLQEPYKRNYNIDNVLQTNGTLLNDEWCRFFKENNVLIGISLDGPKLLNNQYRLNKSNRGSFEQAMRGLELLQKHRVEFNILSTVNGFNVHFPLDVYRFFKSIGAKYIQFTPIVERLDEKGFLKSGEEVGGKLADWSVPALAYGDFLTSVFDEWVRNDVGSVFVSTFDATLAGYMGAAPGSCVWAETCGHASALDVDGSLYACDHYVFPTYKLGNIREKTITEMMLTDQQLQFGNDKRDRLPKICRSCQFLALCHGECPKNRFRILEGEQYPLNYLCNGLKHYFKHTEPYMRLMVEALKQQRPPANIMNIIR